MTPPDITSHPHDLQLAAFLEGRLEYEARGQIMKHLAVCPFCVRRLGDMHRLLTATENLPPLRMEHPIERFLAPLRRALPLPLWGWNGILMTLTLVAWFTLLDYELVVWLQNPLHMGLSFTAIIFITTYFIWFQKKFRGLHKVLWEEGVSREDIERFQTRYLAPLYGYFPTFSHKKFLIEGVWLFLFLAVLINIINAFRFTLLPGSEWDYLAGVIIGMYNVTVMASVQWGWLWGGRYFIGLSRLLQSQRHHISEQILFRARMMGFAWVVVSTVTMMWYLIAAIISGQANETGTSFWVAIVTFQLMVLWIGYLYLEITLFPRTPFLKQQLLAGSRMAFSLLLIIWLGRLTLHHMLL